MPLMTVKLMESTYTANQKQEMIRKFTDTIVAIKGESMRSVTWVVIEEVKSGEWGVGGVPVTTNDVKALATGKSKGLTARYFPKLKIKKRNQICSLKKT